MKIEITIPQLPESVSEATLLNWNKKLGEVVTQGENLIDLETDKVVLEIPAPENGTLVEIKANPGDIVTNGHVIATFETELANAEVVIKNTEQILVSTESSQNKQEITQQQAMPAAKKVAADNDIDLTKIAGTGRNNRILKEDVLNSINNTIKFEERVPMTRLRKKIAERLISSQQTNAILTTFNEVNMQPIMSLRIKYKDTFEKKYGIKLGFMSFFVKAVIHALKQYPLLNASIDGNDIVYHGYFDIGIAVSSPRGLVVPILRNVENMTIAQIEQQIAKFGKKAKDGKLEIEELTGGTFSVTNGGTFGSMLSTPIINPPQSAILGMHAIKERAVVENSQVVVRPMMYLALSYDHRLIDGKEAVSSLVEIKNALEDPTRILLEI